MIRRSPCSRPSAVTVPEPRDEQDQPRKQRGQGESHTAEARVLETPQGTDYYSWFSNVCAQHSLGTFVPTIASDYRT